MEFIVYIYSLDTSSKNGLGHPLCSLIPHLRTWLSLLLIFILCFGASAQSRRQYKESHLKTYYIYQSLSLLFVNFLIWTLRQPGLFRGHMGCEVFQVLWGTGCVVCLWPGSRWECRCWWNDKKDPRSYWESGIRYQVIDIKYQDQSIRPKWEKKRDAEEVRIMLGSGCGCQRAAYVLTCWWGFPGGSDGKESACSEGDSGSIWVGKTPWRREWLPTPVFLEFHGPRSLVGHSPWGHKESGMTEWLTTTTTTCCHGWLSWQEADQLAESTGWACTTPH